MAQRQMEPNPLATLVGLRSRSNMTGAPGMTNRALDVVSGDDWMEPSETELLDMQDAEGVGTRTSRGGDYTTVRSRDSLRDSGMQTLKRTLGLAEIEAANEAEVEMAPERLRGQNQLRERQLANQGAERVARIGADQRVQVAEANAAAKEDALSRLLQGAPNDRSVSVSGVGSVGAPRTAANRPAPPVQQGLYDAVTKARQARDSSMFAPIQRKMGMTPSVDTAYEQALTNVIHRMGNMDDAQSVAAALQGYPGDIKAKMAAAQADPNFEFDLTQLDPYTQQYLELKVR